MRYEVPKEFNVQDFLILNSGTGLTLCRLDFLVYG